MICQADLQIYQGDDYSGTVTVLDSSGNAADLTGSAARAQIRIMPAQYWPYVAADIACTVVTPNTVNLYIPAAVTITLYCTYVWDLQLTDTFGMISTVLNGSVYVEQDITRAPGQQQLESDAAYLVNHRTPRTHQQLQAEIDTGSISVISVNPLSGASFEAKI